MACAAAAAVVCGALVACLKGVALRLRLFDEPTHRSLHLRPTPRVGGLGIACTVVLGTQLAVQAPAVLMTMGLAALIAAIGLWDDLQSLSPGGRLAMQSAIAIGVLLIWRAPGGLTLGPVELSWPAWLGASLAILWLVGFVNAFNFMDGIDGMAGTQAATAATGWLIIATWSGNADLAIVAGLVLGAAIGFLWHNWPPASIFMGDGGSAFLGFVLAVLPWYGGVERLWPLAVLSTWPLVFDTTFTLLRRLRRGERWWDAHRSHLYQRLVVAGWTHRATTALYGMLTAAGVAAAVTLAVVPGRATLAGAAAVVLLGSSGLVVLVQRVERAAGGTVRRRADESSA
jgi:UDP-N-acetylmuramyl pentapeptide phosphotransferase/UDP-N-acetylglucosamine-1-phosphate transferase